MINPVNNGRSAADSPNTRASRTSSRVTSTVIDASWTRGLDLVLGLGRLAASGRHREHSRPAPRRDVIAIDPCIPSAWTEYQLVWTHRETRYEIFVSNTERRCSGVRSATIDGGAGQSPSDPLLDDGKAAPDRIRL